MSEQLSTPDPRPTEIPQLEIDAAHEAANDRDYHETRAAHALGSMKLVEEAMRAPDNTQAYLGHAQLVADFDAADGKPAFVPPSSPEATRDQKVASQAKQAFGMEKRGLDSALGHVTGISENTRARTAADRAISNLQNNATRYLAEADKDEQWGKEQRSRTAA